LRSRRPSEPAFRVFALTAAALWLGLAATSTAGCGQSVIVGLDDALAASGSGGVAQGGSNNGGSGGLALSGTGDVSGSGEAGAAACVKTACRGKYYECGNCIDDDGDGESDERDTACLGPCDDDELGLSTGLKMTSSGACRQDCYFDADAGPGNDMCSWSSACDPLSVAPDYPPSGEARCAYGSQASSEIDCEAPQPAACVDGCQPLAPNGCDCFGCCELPARSGEFHFIGKGRGSLGCQLDALDDEVSCPRCTPVTSCLNTCEECEVCVGGEPEASCNIPAACERGTPCGASVACPSGEYCVTGCCVRAPR
jgi:hypothetical protein